MKKLSVIAGILALTGSLYAQIPTDIYTIQSQMNADGSSQWQDSVVQVSGIVTAVYGVTGSRNFFLEMRQGGPFSGIMVYIPRSAGDFPVQEGESLTLVGTVTEYYNNTELQVNDTTLIVRHGLVDPITPNDLTCDHLDTASTTTMPWDSAEAYEGVLVRLPGVVVTDTLDEYGNYQVSDGSGYVYAKNTFTYTPRIGDRLNLTGIVSTNYGLYKVFARSINDYEFLNAGLSKAYAIDHQKIKVLFKSKMNGDAEDPTKYVFDPAITIDNIQLEADSQSVLITTTDMVAGQYYTLHCNGLTDANGSAITDTVDFYGGIVSISTIQTDTASGADTTEYATAWVGRTVTITGVVTGGKYHFPYPFFFIQEAQAPFSGIQVWDPAGVISPNDGDSIIIVGEITEYRGATEIQNLIYAAVIDSNHVINPILVHTGDLNPSAGWTAEGYEGVLVKVQNAQVTDPGTGDNFVADDGTGGVQIFNYANTGYTPNAGDYLDITGILRYVGQLYVRDTGDIVGISEHIGNIELLKVKSIQRRNISFSISLPGITHISVNVYNVVGRRVVSRDFGKLSMGTYNFTLGRNLPQGVYYIVVNFGKYQVKRKTILLK